jgi:hypothetical protein
MFYLKFIKVAFILLAFIIINLSFLSIAICFPFSVDVKSVGISNKCTKNYIINGGTGNFCGEIVEFSDSSSFEVRNLFKEINYIIDPYNNDTLSIINCIHYYLFEYFNFKDSAHNYLYELKSPNNDAVIGIEYGRSERIKFEKTKEQIDIENRNSNPNSKLKIQPPNCYSYIISKAESDRNSSVWSENVLDYRTISDQGIILKEIFYRPTNKFIGISYTSMYIEHKYFFYEGY